VPRLRCTSTGRGIATIALGPEQPPGRVVLLGRSSLPSGMSKCDPTRPGMIWTGMSCSSPENLTHEVFVEILRMSSVLLHSLCTYRKTPSLMAGPTTLGTKLVTATGDGTSTGCE